MTYLTSNRKHSRQFPGIAIAVYACLLTVAGPFSGQVRTGNGQESPDPDTQPAPVAADTREAILADQQRIAEDYRLLEEKLFSLYQYEQEQNPERAKLLQDAYQNSREKLTVDQFRQAIAMLQQSRLRDAEKNQATATAHLEQLLELLQSEDRHRRIREDRDRYREYLKEVDRILRIQQGIRGRVESRDPAPDSSEHQDLQNQQDRISGQTADLNSKIKQESPGSGQAEHSTPANAAEPSGQHALQQAEQNMRRAVESLEQAAQENAVQQMRDAERDLARARDELEKSLRQLREEEIQRSLASLESRFRKMLEVQLKIHEETLAIDERFRGRQDPQQGIEANRLSGSQRELVTEADRAQLVLEDDGSSVATMETVRQLGMDLSQIADRLAASRTGTITRQIQTDAIETLGFLVDAFEQAQKDLEQQANQPPGEAGQPPPGQQALVNRLAELKLIRGLQTRILSRHRRYATLLPDPGDPAGYSDEPEIRAALEQLAGRQLELQQVTADIVREEKRRAAAPGDQ